MQSIADFQYSIVHEFVKQVLEGFILSSIEETHHEFQNFYKKINEWISINYNNGFEYQNNEKIQQITKEIFNQILYFRLTGKLSGIISINKFGKNDTN